MKKVPLLVFACLFVLNQVEAVILFDTGDPGVNTSAPTGTLAGSGWQYEGDWGSFLGTPISPSFFISAAHIGMAGSGLSFGDTTYPVVGSYSLPGSDLLVWKVAGTFPTFAPLYIQRNEVGQHLVVIGRGTQRGAERKLNRDLRGWDWGPGDGVRRWGENDVANIVPYSGHDLVYATFDQHVVPNDHPNEAHLSSGDSGGGVFLKDGGIWKIAGISFAVDDLYTGPSSDMLFNAAIFDARGYYTTDPNNSSVFVQISGADSVSTGFYASRISSELAWIGSVIADPQVGFDSNPTFTYWRLNAPASDIGYEVQQSSDLASWSPAAAQEQPLSTAGDLNQIKATIDPMGADHLFFRLKVTRP